MPLIARTATPLAVQRGEATRGRAELRRDGADRAIARWRS
jgi:hypothetical protein